MGSGKERGHLGSEIQRKCYGLLTIEKKNDISTLRAKIMRKAANGDVPEIPYKFCKEKGYHIPIEAEDNEAIKDGATMMKMKELSKKIFKQGNLILILRQRKK
jgi:hypothetical protein